MSRLLDERELARELKFSIARVKRMARAGEIPAIQYSRNHYRFDLEDVVAALKAPRRSYTPRLIPKTDQDARVLRALANL